MHPNQNPKLDDPALMASVDSKTAQLKADLAKVGDVVIKEWIEKAGAEGKAILDAYKAAK